MVLRLATALDIPLRQHNALLIAAGFAPVWRETDLDAPELARGARARSTTCWRSRSPIPAVAVDRHWNLLQGQRRRGAPGRVPGRAAGAGHARSISPMRWSAPDVLRPVSAQLGRGGALFPAQRRGRCRGRRHGARRRRCSSGCWPTTACARLLKPRVDRGRQRRRCCRCISAKARSSLRLFTTIATLGTPQDITAQELRIESFFPMDRGPPRCCAAGLGLEA